MEERNELSDIMLENASDNKSQNIKRILVIVALLILLFIFIIAIMKILNKKEEPNSIINDDELISLINQDTSLKTQDNNFSNVKVENIEVVENEVLVEQVSEIPKIVDIQNQTREVKTKQQASELKKQNTTTKNTVKTNDTVNTATNGIYYIQVASILNGKPNKAFLSKVTKNNYGYIEYETMVNSKNYTKVLIGPYASENEARKAMFKVKNDIVQDAFLYKMR